MLKETLNPRDIDSINTFLNAPYESSELFLIDLFTLKHELEGVPSARAWFKDVLVQYRAAVEAQKLLTPRTTPASSVEQFTAHKAILNLLILRLDMIASAYAGKDEGAAEYANKIRDNLIDKDPADISRKELLPTLEKLIKEIDEAYKKSGTKNLSAILTRIDKVVQTLSDISPAVDASSSSKSSSSSSSTKSTNSKY
jgi:hypothetical protein